MVQKWKAHFCTRQQNQIRISRRDNTEFRGTGAAFYDNGCHRCACDYGAIGYQESL